MGARKWLAGLVSVSLLTCQTFAQGSRSSGIVIQAAHARIEGFEALSGATVFLPQRLSTDPGGQLLVRVGPAQVNVAGDSAVRLESRNGRLRATVERGSASLSSTDPHRVELYARHVLIRAQGPQSAHTSVTLVGKNELLLTSFSAPLVAEYAGVTQVIPAGASYKARVAPQETEGAGRRRGVPPIVWVAIGAGVGLGIGLWLALRDGRQPVSPAVP